MTFRRHVRHVWTGKTLPRTVRCGVGRFCTRGQWHGALCGYHATDREFATNDLREHACEVCLHEEARHRARAEERAFVPVRMDGAVVHVAAGDIWLSFVERPAEGQWPVLLESAEPGCCAVYALMRPVVQGVVA